MKYAWLPMAGLVFLALWACGCPGCGYTGVCVAVGGVLASVLSVALGIAWELRLLASLRNIR